MATVPSVPELPNASLLANFRRIPDDDPSCQFPNYEEHRQANRHAKSAWKTAQPTAKFRIYNEALRIFPFSVEAYNSMGFLFKQEWNDLDKAKLCYERAIQAANAIYTGLQYVQHFSWDCMDNRPYLRSHHGLGVILMIRGELEEAASHFQYCLKVDPADSQGSSVFLASVLAGLGDFAGVESLLLQSPETSNDCWFRYSLLLSNYVKHKLGLCSDVQLTESLAKALEANCYAPHLLLLVDCRGPSPVMVSPGGFSEAVSYVHHCLEAWRKVDGVLTWLREKRDEVRYKPNDGGVILFQLLQKGFVPLQFAGIDGRQHWARATTRISQIPGHRSPQFRLSVGMVVHDPDKIVCFMMDESDDGGHISKFSYESVTAMPFWSTLTSYDAFGESMEIKVCNVCFQPADLLCSNCKVARYCSRECQVQDWTQGHRGPNHKTICQHYIKK